MNLLELLEDMENKLPQSMTDHYIYKDKYANIHRSGFNKAKKIALNLIKEYKKNLKDLDKCVSDIDSLRLEKELLIQECKQLKIDKALIEKSIPPKSVHSRFMSKVNAIDSGCWLWTGKKDSSGYGVAFKNHLGERRAHRLSYAMFSGPIPEGMFVCHKCDIPPCVNPEHLFVGYPNHNMQDMVRKGRSRKNVGENASRVKYTEKQIREAIDLHKNGHGYTKIAEATGINRGYIRDLVKGRYWKHLNLIDPK